MVESITLNGRCLEFDTEAHTYTVDGIAVPSVTQVVRNRFPDMYRTVPEPVLRAAADRGSAIHAAIERYCQTGWDRGLQELTGFKALCEVYDITQISNELPVIICDGDEPVMAGTTDLVFDRGGLLCGGDIKTTARLDREYLECQLNLYRIGYEQTYGVRWDKLYALHLRGTVKTLTEIPVNEDLARDIIREVLKC